MKYLLLILLVSLSAFAQKKETLEEQISLSRDIIDQFIYNVRKNNNDDILNLEDYYQWRREYDIRVEEALMEYENTLKERVFGALMVLRNRYYSTLDNESLNIEQKSALLQALKEQIESIRPTIELNYRKAVQKLYLAHAMIPNEIKKYEQRTIYYNKRGKEVNHSKRNGSRAFAYKLKIVFNDELTIPFKDEVTTSQSGQYYNLWSTGYYSSTFIQFSTSSSSSKDWNFVTEGCDKNDYCSEKIKEYKDTIHYPLLKYLQKSDYKMSHYRFLSGCETQSCVLMKISDIIFYNANIEHLLAKDINIYFTGIRDREKNKKYPRGFSYVIKAPNLSLINNLSKKVLQRTDYSDEYKNLPYNI